MSSHLPHLAAVGGQVPLCTFCVTTLCIGLQVYTFLIPTKLANFTLAAVNVIYLGEYYRIISAALLHGGLMHIAFNMMSFLSIGSGLEMNVGTLALTFVIIWSIILAGAIYVAAEWAMTVWITQDLQYVQQPAVGFSGVIFTLALMESYRSTVPTRSIFGIVQVPTKLYPWALLVVLSVVIPRISFMGHLSGILVGMLHVHGYTKPLLPSPASLVAMEGIGFIRDNMVRRSNFVPCPRPPPGADGDEAHSSSGSLRRMSLPISALCRRIALRIRNRDVTGGGSDASDGDIEASRRPTASEV